MTISGSRAVRVVCLLIVLMLSATAAFAQTATAGQLVISELRLRGPNGANDEFIEIQNRSGANHTVVAASGTGYGVAASDGVTRCSIPNGTVFPVNGHYLCVNSVGYSLASYPAGNGTTATGDATYTTDIPDNAGVTLFNNNTGGASYSLANRLDAVGTTSEANALYKEGAGLPALTPFSIDYAWVRDSCGKDGSITTFGPCPSGGFVTDTDNNAADFYFVDTNGTSAGGGQRLGAPGPENLSSPLTGGPTLAPAPLDPCVAMLAPPNTVRDFTSDPANNSTFGTLDIRHTFTNNTGGDLTRLRFRVVDLTTFPAPSGFADLRPRTSTAVVVTVDRPPCGSGTSNVTVQGTTLEQPPSQPNGGGFNSSMSAGTVTLATPIANGASIDVRFLLGIQQTGNYKFAVVPEGLPMTGSAPVIFEGCTNGCPAPAGDLVISELRLRGPSGANDEFIEIHNRSGADHTVSPVSGSGYGIAASDGVTRCSIPTGTVIPNNGHYLCVNVVAYSLSGYPAGNGTTANGDATYNTDIPDNAGIALFNNNSGGGSYSLANRIDAVGTTSEANVLYKEGTGVPALTPFSIDYAWVRDACGKDGSITTFGPCPAGGFVTDTDDNAADFYFVDSNGTSAGGGQRLGAAGPENLSSPVYSTAPIVPVLLDACVALTSPPNIVRDLTSDPANNSTFGTVDIRHTFTNNTGAPLTRLRFRVIDLTTFPAPSGIADLRPRTSTSVVVTVDRAPCGSGTSNITVAGTTLEQPPPQPNGGGFNSTMSVGAVTLATPLANGASIDVRFLLGIQQNGNYKFGIIPEALPEGGSAPVIIEGCTGGACAPPTVVSITRLDPNPTNAASVQFSVVFSEAVTGVDTSDFALTTTGTLAGSSVTSVSGAGTSYTVTVATGTGDGTLRLDVADDDSIIDGDLVSLGGAGAGNGSFTTGEVYTIFVVPTVTSVVVSSGNPTSAATATFTVTFSEPVTGVDITDFALTTAIGGASITGVAGAGAVYTVTINTGSADGTIRLDVIDNDSIVDGGANPLGGAGAGNGNFTTGEVLTVVVAPVVTSVVVSSGNPTSAATATFTVTFSEPVTGVDVADFALTTAIGGASITGVAGAGAVYTVTINTGSADGTIRLDVVDNDSIVDGGATPLGGAGAGNGSFTTGEVLTVVTPPFVVSVVPSSGNPTSAATATFTVTFSEPVTGVDVTDFLLTTLIPGASITGVSGSGAVYTVTINTGSANGTIRLDVIDDDTIVDADLNPLGGVGSGNGAFAGGVALAVQTVPIPTLSPTMLALLAVLLAGFATMMMRK